MPEYGFQFTDAAAADLDEIFQYISGDLSNPQAAAAFMNKLDETIRLICRFPDAGSPTENRYIRNRKIRKMPVKNYILYYLPDRQNQTVVILRIIYGKRYINTVTEE